MKAHLSATNEWKKLAQNDWGEILKLSEQKSFQRKFQIVEAFTELTSKNGYHLTTHADIANACGVTRQLIDHHFPNDRSLLSLTYRYVYARFQKYAADSLILRQSALDQFRAYIMSIPKWIVEYRSDARFLSLYYAISPVYPELFKLHERNIRIGQERIQTLLLSLRSQKLIPVASNEALTEYASSVQQLLIGHVVLYSGRNALSPALAKAKSAELLRSCLVVINVEFKSGKSRMPT